MNLNNVILLCQTLSLGLKSGLNQGSILKSIAEKSHYSRSLKSFAKNWYQEVEKGYSLKDSLRQPSLTSYAISREQYFFAMIAAGETSGSLSESFDALEQHYTQERKLQKQLAKSLIYPTILLLFLGLFLAIIGLFVMPKLAPVFSQLNVPLSPILKILSLFSQQPLLIGLGFLPALLNILAITTLSSGPIALDSTIKTLKPILFFIPILRTIAPYRERYLLLNSLSSLYSTGLNLAQCLEISHKISQINGPAISEKELQHGLANALNHRYSLDPLVQAMLATGEETGKFDEILNQATEFYYEKLSDSISQSQMIITGFIFLVAVVLILSAIIPLFSFFTNLWTYF